MKPTVSDSMRARVLELRRTLSLRQVAEQTGLPLGTVKTICSRSGAFRDNLKLRELFTLPPLQVTPITALTAPELPPQEPVTGDKEVDAVLWLRSVINTGHAALIDKALQAFKRIKTPMKELEGRYKEFVQFMYPNNPLAGMSAFGFADLEDLAQRVTRNKGLQQEATDRFGDSLFDDTPAERFCIEALAGLERTGNIMEFDAEEVRLRFEAHPELMPHTLSDCLFERAYWNSLYRLRHAVNGYGDSAPEAYAREEFVFELMAKIRPRSKDEALAVFRHLSDCERMGQVEADPILLNLIGCSYT